MVKRKGSRPGQRPAARAARPGQRSPVVTRPTGGLTPSEEARAAQIEAEILERERALEQERDRLREMRRPASQGLTEMAPRTRAGSALAVRGEQEYAYVVRDVQRIIRVGGSLVGALFILFILIDVLGVIRF